MGIVTTSSATAFQRSAETVYDFVTDPANWTKTYPGSEHIGDLPELPLIEAARDAPLPDGFFRIVNPANIDRYHDAVARELDTAHAVDR